MLRVLLVAWLPALAGVVSAPSRAVGSAPSIARAAVSAVPTGATANLRCTVLNLGDRQVSWVRSRDLQILSHAGVVFTGDGRVTAPHGDSDSDSDMDSDSDNSVDLESMGDISHHSLRIASVRASDAGRYECQLNTEPKMSKSVNLTVLESPGPPPGPGPGRSPRGRVRALPPRVAAPRGGAALLQCEAGPGGGLPLRWYRHGELITPQDGVGSVSLEWREWGGGAGGGVSRLRLGALRGPQGGPYRCQRGAAAAAGGGSAGGSHDTVTLVVDDIANDEALAMHADSNAAPAWLGRSAAATAVAGLALLLGGGWR